MAAPARVKEVQPLRGASANQPSLPAYARALTNWPPSNPISKAFFSIHTFVLGARLSIPAAANACSSRIASARSISVSNPGLCPEDLEHLGMTTPEDWDGFDDIWRCWCKGLPSKQ